MRCNELSVPTRRKGPKGAPGIPKVWVTLKPGNVALAAEKVPRTFPCASGTCLHPKTDECELVFGHNEHVLHHTTSGTSSTSTWTSSHGSHKNNNSAIYQYHTTGHLHLIYRVKTVIFHSYVNVYQRAMGN